MFKRYMFIEGLTNLIGSNGKCLINNDGQIKDIKGNDFPYSIDNEGHKTVHCSGWNGEQTYRVIDLVAIQFKSLTIPLEKYSDIEAFVLDGNKNNTHANNVGYRFKNGPIEFKNKSGFYYVPGMPSIIINKEGIIANTVKGNIFTLSKTPPDYSKNIKGGYLYVNSSFEKGRTVRYLRHRALCLTFKPYPDNVDSLTVNHIDGIPGNDNLDNLEWATKGENNLHAYVNDLKNQHHRVLVRDVISGNITEYYSISECSRKLGYATDETIRHRLKTSKFGQVFQDGTQIKYKSDERDWIIPDNPEKAVREARERIPIKVRNCKTFEITEYSSISDASLFLDINVATINLRLKSDNRTPIFGYQFKYSDDNRDFIDFTNEEYINSLKPNNYEIEARNILTGEKITYSSIREASKIFGNKLNYNILEGKQPLDPSGWQYKLKKDPWFDSRDFDEQFYKNQHDITARKEDTGEIIIASDSTKLASILKLDRKSVRKAAYTRGNQIYKGYRFRLGVTLDPWPTTQIQFKTCN